jgi:hypothetical protein
MNKPMSDEQTPSVEEIKARLSDEEDQYMEIPVDEDPVDPQTLKIEEQPDIVVELRNLGRQFAHTLQTAWNSQEWKEFEGEVREGMKTFADEVDKAFREVKKSPVTQKAKEEATTLKTKVETGEVGQKTKSGLAQGLSWLSDELAKLADQFTPVEKSPEEMNSNADDAD